MAEAAIAIGCAGCMSTSINGLLFVFFLFLGGPGKFFGSDILRHEVCGEPEADLNLNLWSSLVSRSRTFQDRLPGLPASELESVLI